MTAQPGDPASSSCIPLLGIDQGQLTLQLAQWGEPAYRARQILDWVYKKRATEFAAMTNLSAALHERLAERYIINRCKPASLSASSDQTDKFLIELHDRRYIETVLIPASPALYGEPSDRRTLCVSSQVGCAYGCRFCASGLMGWTRHLEPDEIVAQLLVAEARSGERVNNIVFMGMGEPLANYDNWLAAVRILNAPWGLEIGARRMTVSTSGLAPQIRRLANEPFQIRLAVSLHGATDDVRERIMPINRRYPIAELMTACADFQEKRRSRITFEFILIEGVNDDPGQARALAHLARPLGALVNLIPYNTVEGLDWRRPPRERQERFRKHLEAAGVAATLRREKGHDIDAACGQLRLRTERDASGSELAHQSRLPSAPVAGF